MLELIDQNLGQVTASNGLSVDEMMVYAPKLALFMENIRKRDQGFYEVIDDGLLIEEIEKFGDEVSGKYDFVVVLGIGGSALGTICLQQSLKHLFENSLKTAVPKLFVLDNVDPTLIGEIDDVINYKKTLFLVVTKSGGTPETLAQFFYFREKIMGMKLSLREHFVFVTDPKKGLLRELANNEQVRCFSVPENVGGRFSVLTAVGLLPAKLIGIDIRGLIAGAKSMRDLFLSENFVDNIPFRLAVMQFLLGEKGKNINVLIPYSQKLIRFADWYRQLLAESIGKARNDKGELVNVGLTPVNALGVTDQHSQSQLYNEGPNDKFFIFIEVENFGLDLKIPSDMATAPEVAFLKDVSFGELMRTEKLATERAFTQNDRPNVTIRVPEVKAETLGELFMLFEGATAFLGELYGINAFDQPGVELSKILTRELLE